MVGDAVAGGWLGRVFLCIKVAFANGKYAEHEKENEKGRVKRHDAVMCPRRNEH